jgi:hypothetical protein
MSKAQKYSFQARMIKAMIKENAKAINRCRERKKDNHINQKHNQPR